MTGLPVLLRAREPALTPPAPLSRKQEGGEPLPSGGEPLARPPAEAADDPWTEEPFEPMPDDWPDDGAW
jgi:hypothetical protein